jgi:hypothetical protein
MNNNNKFYQMAFATVYPLYIEKVRKRGCTKNDVDQIIFWLTGYDAKLLERQVKNKTNFEFFFKEAPSFNVNASKVTGVICGYRIEEIEDELIKKVRILDKLIDELAKGKTMEKILRK